MAGIVGDHHRREEDVARQDQNAHCGKPRPARRDHVADEHTRERPAYAHQHPRAAAAALHIGQLLRAKKRRLRVRLLERQQPRPVQVVFGFGAARFCLALRRLLLCFSAGPLLLGRGGDGLASRRLLLLLETDGVLVVVYSVQ